MSQCLKDWLHLSGYIPLLSWKSGPLSDFYIMHHASCFMQVFLQLCNSSIYIAEQEEDLVNLIGKSPSLVSNFMLLCIVQCGNFAAGGYIPQGFLFCWFLEVSLLLSQRYKNAEDLGWNSRNLWKFWKCHNLSLCVGERELQRSVLQTLCMVAMDLETHILLHPRQRQLIHLHLIFW
jgi:hypothetical protein